MQKDNNVITYIYKRNTINEDDNYMTYIYTLVGVAVGKEEEIGNYSYTFTPDSTMCSNEELIDKTFVSIDDPACLSEEYVYSFPSYLADMDEEDIYQMYEKSLDEAGVVSEYTLCQIYQKGSTSINTQYIDPDRYDLIDSIWKNRPPMSEYPAFMLDETYSGESTASKLERIRKSMKEAGATVHLMITYYDTNGILLE